MARARPGQTVFGRARANHGDGVSVAGEAMLHVDDDVIEPGQPGGLGEQWFTKGHPHAECGHAITPALAQ